VQLSAGRQWFIAESPAQHVRISVAAASPDEIAEAMRRLAALRFP
jgi:DNA-binding transcriptional MocR family regulator